MQTLAPTPDDLVKKLLRLSRTEPVCILDSCGANAGGEGLLIAGASPSEVMEHRDASSALSDLEALTREFPAVFFSLSYDLGLRINGIRSQHPAGHEPFVWAAAYESVFVHDYASGKTFSDGPGVVPELPGTVSGSDTEDHRFAAEAPAARSEISRLEYLSKIEEIKELIRSGETYQTNLTQKISSRLPDGLSGRVLYDRLRRQHPSTHSAYFSRGTDEVVSISPERFFRVTDLSAAGSVRGGGRIKASPIKGTRPRAAEPGSDKRLRHDLAESEKDRAENTMIVDLLRNDLGRVCRFGSVSVTELCQVQELPSLFHLVSTIEGDLSLGIGLADILEALFPCGSITGCPKHRTMQIIDEIEPSARGLSMGAVGYAFRTSDLPELALVFGASNPGAAGNVCADLSVAIRTMTVRDRIAEFNVGGGIVIDSDPQGEYRESLDKASALLAAIGTGLPGNGVT